MWRVRRIYNLVDSLKSWSHDHKCGHKYASVHFDHSEYVVEDVGVLRFGFRERVGVEHDDESSDGETGMHKTKKNKSYE